MSLQMYGTQPLNWYPRVDIENSFSKKRELPFSNVFRSQPATGNAYYQALTDIILWEAEPPIKGF